MAYVRRCTALMLLILLITATLAMMAGPVSADSCVGMDLTVMVLGIPINLLTNGCSYCSISQGPGSVGTNEFGIPETSVSNFTCFNA